MTMLRRIPKYADWCRRQNNDLSYRLLQLAQMMIANLIGATPDENNFTLSLANLSVWEAQAVNETHQINDAPQASLRTVLSVTNLVSSPSPSQSTDQVLTEAELLRQTKDERITIGVFHVWKAKIHYLYGHLDAAWEAIEKAATVRPYMANLIYEADFVFTHAMVALALIGRHEVHIFSFYNLQWEPFH
jgi:hypothetical protein